MTLKEGGDDEREDQKKDSASNTSSLKLDIRRRRHETPPAHHVTSKIDSRLLSSLPSALSSAQALVATPFEALPGSHKEETDVEVENQVESNVEEGSKYSLRGFCNPWPSWHKPRIGEVWNGLRWTKKANDAILDDAVLEEAAVQLSETDLKEKEQEVESLLDGSQDQSYRETSLHIVQPDLSQPVDGMVKATWLGHASVLLQLPSNVSMSKEEKASFNILFDPIFSMRCSPTQYVGPLRFFPSPCSISSLPRIDLIIISHSHYDHLDYDSVVALWHVNQDYIHFMVPLGLQAWFLSLNIGIPQDRITDLDWWDEVWLHDDSTPTPDDQLRVICTPAQHGSGRYGLDASRSLWASWTLEHISRGNTFRVFFGGDTGFQFQSPTPNSDPYPTCPAFAEVCKYIGKPDLSFLPISVGASFNFIKSYDMLGVVPEVDHGLTAANHLTPYDAVRVAKILRDFSEDDASDAYQLGGVAMAIHWGTFVVDLDEAKQSMNDLKKACELLQVDFVRSIDQRKDKDKVGQEYNRLQFACINHGQSIYLATQ